VNIYYRVPAHCEESTYGPVSSALPDHRSAAEVCALHYFQYHDGWEARWPLTFALYETERGEKLCELEVELESRPEFTAGTCGHTW